MIAGGSKPEVNKEGIAYYNNLVDGLLKQGDPSHLPSTSGLKFCMLCEWYSAT